MKQSRFVGAQTLVLRTHTLAVQPSPKGINTNSRGENPRYSEIEISIKVGGDTNLGAEDTYLGGATIPEGD